MNKLPWTESLLIVLLLFSFKKTPTINRNVLILGSLRWFFSPRSAAFASSSIAGICI